MSQKQENQKLSKEVKPTKLTIPQRRRRVFDMRIKGMTVISIAETLNVDSKTVNRDLDVMNRHLVNELRKKRKCPDVDKFWAQRLASLEKRKLEAWASMLESKKDRAKLQEVLVLIDEEIERAHKMARIKLTDADPKDLITDTIEIIHRNAP